MKSDEEFSDILNKSMLIQYQYENVNYEVREKYHCSLHLVDVF